MTKRKILPQALDAERSVLGSIMIDPEAIFKVADLLKPEDFYSGMNKKIFAAMLELYKEHTPIDLITVGDLLEAKKQLDAMGGTGAIGELSTEVPSPSHIVEYAEIVHKKAILRKVIKAAHKIDSLGYEEEKELNEILEGVEKEVFSISQNFIKDRFVPFKEIISKRFEEFARLHESEDENATQGILANFGDMDRILGGFQPSDLIVLAARPSMGKTALSLSLAMNIAVNSKKTVGIFSLEMSKEQVVDRMFASKLKVNAWKLQKGKLSEDDFKRMGSVMDDISGVPIYIDDAVDATIPELRAKARRLQMEHGLDFIILDYLQLMTTGEKAYMNNRVQEIAEISRSLKGLARELHIPVLALSQLSRNVESRNDKRPVLSDLRDSGAIEQDADVVMMLYRDDYYNEDSDFPGITEVWVRKHRNGPIGHFDLRFDKSQMCFYSVDKKHEGE